MNSEIAKFLPNLTEPRLNMFRDIQLAVCDQADGVGFTNVSNRRIYNRSKSYPYIQLYHEEFVRMVVPHLRPGMHVVDVGCGAGDKLLAFRDLEPTLRITGIEHDPTMVAFARYVCPTAVVREADALAEDYSGYDLIYMYCPMSDRDFQAALQARCMLRMKRGAILLVALQCMIDPETGFRFPDFYEGWVKP